MAVFPRVIEVKASIVASLVVANPVAIVVDMRSLRVAVEILVTPVVVVMIIVMRVRRMVIVMGWRAVIRFGTMTGNVTAPNVSTITTMMVTATWMIVPMLGKHRDRSCQQNHRAFK